MPDFDKNLKPILKNEETHLPNLDNPVSSSGRAAYDQSVSNRQSAVDQFFGKGPIVNDMAPTVTAKELYENRRYDIFSSDITDIENQKANAQSWEKQAANGILKGLNLAATTTLGGFAMLGGALEATFSGRLADIWDNKNMRDLDDWNNKVDQEYLPNYYSTKETTANWYSTDNWFRPNFLFDKVIKNSGYAVGAMISGNIANAGILKAGALIGELADAYAVGAEAAQSFKTASPLLRNIARAFSVGKNIEAAQVLEKGIASIADITTQSSELADIASQTNKFFGINDVGRRTAMAAYSSAGESSFEALQTSREYRKNAIAEYTRTHGQEPVGSDLDQINQDSESVGKVSFFANMGVLSATEYVQLPKILGSSYSASKQAANSLMGQVDNVLLKDGKYVAEEAATKFGKIYDKVTGVSHYIFDPKEALQEGIQTGLQVGVQNYYNKASQTGNANVWVDGFLYGLNGTKDGKGVGVLNTKEGAESILLGGLTGGLMQIKGGISEARANSANTQAFLNTLNTTPSFKQAFQDRIAGVNRGVILQQQQKDAIVQGDKLEAKDLDADLIHNYLAPRIKYGRSDMILDDIKELKRDGLTEGGLSQLKEQGLASINDTVESYQERLANFERSAKQTNELYKSLDLRYSGQIDEKGERKYSHQVIDKMVYAASKISDYDTRIPQVSSLLTKAGIDTTGILTDIIKNKKSNKEATDIAIEQIDSMDVTSEIKDDLKSALNDTIELSLRRKLFIDQYDDVKNNPAKYTTKEQEPVADVIGAVDEKKKTIKVKTEKGDTDLEIGTEYYLGKTVSKTAEGNDVYGFPTLTILGENENGTIKIRDGKGEERDISKEQLAKYKLGRVDSLKKDKTANYYFNHINDVFQYNFGKKFGGKIRGRLEYNPETKVLNFVYKDGFGKTKYKQIDNTHFTAQGEYADARIKKVGTLVAETAAQKQAREEFTSKEELTKTQAKIESKVAERRRIIKEISDDAKANSERIDKRILAKKEQLEKLNQELSDLGEFRQKGKYDNTTVVTAFNKVFSRSMKGLTKLTGLKASLEKEISDLQAHKDDLDFNISYFEDLLQNVQELPEKLTDVLASLKSDIGALESLTANTGIQINQFSKLIDSTDKTIKELTSFLQSAIEKFDKDYHQYIRDSFERMLSEGGDIAAESKSILEYTADLALLEDTKKEIILNRSKLVSLSDKIDDLYKQLEEVGKIQTAKEEVLKAFEGAIKEELAKRAEEERLKKDTQLAERILGTLNKDSQTIKADKDYEMDPKKSTQNIPVATVSTINLPGYELSNKFGIDLESLPNRAAIRGIIVTSKNEASYGLGATEESVGLTEHLNVAGVDPTKTIVLVAAELGKDGVLRPVGVDGKPLTTPNVNDAIYQVMPAKGLVWSTRNNESMFREGTDDDTKAAIIEQYDTWRNETLDNPPVVPFEIEASFGIPDYVGNLSPDGKTYIRDYTAKTSVEESGLISNEDLLGPESLIHIPKLEETISRGSTSFSNALGFPFLALKNAFVKLENNNLTAQQAITVYNAIHQFAKEMFESNDGSNSEKGQVLLDYLRSTIYWGTPREGKSGYNNVHFAKDSNNIVQLYMSGLGEAVCAFSPTDIEINKDAIISLLGKMYHNINSKKVESDWNLPYREITSIDENGNIQSKDWQNYQTYLLSSEGRKAGEIPLTTQMKPVKEGQINRKNVYFIIKDNIDKFQVPDKKEEKVATVPEVKTAQTPTPTAEKPTGFDLNGKENIISNPALGVIKFTATKDGNITFTKDADGNINADTFEVVKKIATDKGIELEQAAKILADSVIVKVRAEIAAAQEKVATPEESSNQQVEQEIDAPFDIENDNDEFEQQASTANERNNTPLRIALVNQMNDFEKENWTKVEEWLTNNFPNLPVYKVKNILKGTNGLQAWGMLKDGAIYVYENAEVGTIYHEVFEGVWKMFAGPNEVKAIQTEFKSRPGSFVDRPTGKTINYKDATPTQLKEQLAEEFRDYIKDGKIPVKPVSGKNLIQRLFSDLLNFIKNFFTGNEATNNTEKLFEKINKGYYKKYSPYHTKLSFAKEGFINIDNAEFTADNDLRIANIREGDVHSIMEHMTWLTLTNLVKTNKSLFNINAPGTKTELYERLNKEILTNIAQVKGLNDISLKKGEITKESAATKNAEIKALWKSVKEGWSEIEAKHEEFLLKYNVEFDENDEIALKEEDKTKDNPYGDTTKIDNFRKMNSVIRLLLATVPVSKIGKNGKPQLDYSSIGMVKLLPVGETYMALMNNLHTSTSATDMFVRLKAMAINDVNYRPLYERLTNNDPTLNLAPFANVKDQHELQLISAFCATFSQQNSEVKTVIISENGDVIVGDANFTTATNQINNDFNNKIKLMVKDPKNPYFAYSDSQKAYIGIPGSVKGVVFTDDVNTHIRFLKTLGIDFKKSDIVKLPNKEQQIFKIAAAGIRQSISEAKKITTLSGKTLEIYNKLKELAEIKAKIDNPEFSSTFYNVNGEKTQTFIGRNAVSNLHDFLSQTENRKDLINTSYEYLVKGDQGDVFSQRSILLDKIYHPVTGAKLDTANSFLKAGWADGTSNKTNGKDKTSSKQTLRDRLIQQLNLNFAGYYYTLVPGDSSMEHMVYMGNNISENQLLLNNFQPIYDIFKGYFIDEVNLARDNRPTAKKRDNNDLRFFKPILGKDLHDSIIADKESTPEKLYENNKSKIESALKNFIESERATLIKQLEEYKILEKDSDEEELIQQGTYKVNNLSIGKDMKDFDVNRHMLALTANFMINNIELHKILFSDPYQYSDELKRIKNFLSPRKSLIANSKEMNSALNVAWNKGYKKGDIGYTNFDVDYFKSQVLTDVLAYHDLPGYNAEEGDTEWEPYEETDGGGIITMKANRIFGIRSGDWNDAQELQYNYDVAWEKEYKSKGLSEEQIKKQGLTLSNSEKELLTKGNPEVKSAYTPRKPIVSGNKNDGKNYNDIVLDKFSLYPLSFRVMTQLNPESNLVKMYNKMQNENVDYVVFNSGRKVGATNSHNIYDENGNFNNTKFNGITNIPFSIMSVQSEVPSKDTPLVTRGSQMTKLATLDFMEAGVPIDFIHDKSTEFTAARYKEWYNLSLAEKEKQSPLFKEIKNNQNILQALTEYGYNSLLKRLSIEKQADGSFKINDKDVVLKTLRGELLSREVNDNVFKTLKGFENGDVVLQASPIYSQIKNILYSIADKEAISPKITGGFKVQISSAMFETNKVKSELINGKQAYTSDVLNFYVNKKGERVCEIMLARWFDSDMSDEALLEYLNNTDEGRKILSGIGFRTPTQKQNSIDVFKIAKFLPKEFGDSVVVPSALVKKVGSDFDIDKLSVYLKNTFKNINGELKIIPSLGVDKVEARKEFDKIFATGEFLSPKALADLDRIIEEERDKFEELREDSASGRLIASIFKDALSFSEEEITKDFINYIAKSTPEELKDKIFDSVYKKSLENDYIQSLQNLVSHELNFDNLIKPNSAEQLKKLAKTINEKLGREEVDYSSTGNMLSPVFMAKLRHDFVTGKYAIGIAAIAQTNHAQNQRTSMYIDLNKLKTIDKADKQWLGNGLINFDKFNKMVLPDGNTVTTLSKIKNADGQYISDIIGQFIDGYVDISKGPWIMDLGATPNVASTWLFLTKIGVPIDTVAYFMNQPIIIDYLKSIENAGYSWLFIGDYVDALKDGEKYGISKKEIVNKSVKTMTKSSLETSLGKTEFNTQEKVNQQFILDEFLKYAMMANHLYQVTQGTNYDTANINNGYLVYQKEQQLEKANNTIFSSADKLLENSHVGKLASAWTDIRNVLAEVIKSDKGNMREVVQNVLDPYINMNSRDFAKLSQKVENDIFDYIMQTNDDIDKGKPLNTFIKSILTNNETNSAKAIGDFVSKVRADDTHPLYNNQVIKILSVQSADKAGGVNNITVKNKDNKVYDQNQLIFAFQELKEYLNGLNSNLYKQLVATAVLQSGLTPSKISFTTLLPYEDFKDVYNNALFDIENNPDLAGFYNMNVFQRNNWNNDDIVPTRKAKYVERQDGRKDYNRNMQFKNTLLEDAQNKGLIPSILKLDARSREANRDVIVYTWEKGRELLTEEDIRNKVTLAQKKAQMRKEGNYSYIQKGLFKKLYDGDNAFAIQDYYGNDNYIYKMINAWGDGSRANEFYNQPQKSVLDNGFIKVEKEVADGDIIPYLSQENAKGNAQNVPSNQDVANQKVVSSQGIDLAPEELLEDYSQTTGLPIGTKIDSSKKINIYAGTGENAELSNFANRPFILKDGDISFDMGDNFKRDFYSVEQAFQYIKSIVAGDPFEGSSEVTEKIANETNGAKLKALGSKNSLTTFPKGLKEWDAMSKTIMYELLVTSFGQNPKALTKLLVTGNAELTHIQDRGKWGTEFPKLLMRVRSELANSKTLEKAGFSPSEIGKILKSIC